MTSTTPPPAAPGGPPADAAGALKGGEAQRGDPASAPRPLGRKDPAVTGDPGPDPNAAAPQE